MKKTLLAFATIAIMSLTFFGCKNDKYTPTPEVPYEIELNNVIFHNGDSLFGKIVVKGNELANGLKVRKIDCRLGNIVIGTVKDELVCPFGIRLKDKPLGEHTISVIFKCEAPKCDETFWRYDIKMITII